MVKLRNLYKFQLALLAFCFAAFICLIVPVQTFVGNVELFNYSLADVVKAHFEYGYFLLNQVADFFDRLKETGVYDNSVIILAADHGLIVLREGDGTKGHGAESSILWVKPAYADQPFAFCDVPTSNFKVSDLIRAERTRDLAREEIDAILEMHDRTFIAKFGASFWSVGRAIYFYQWRYDDENRVVACEKQGVFQAN